MEHVIRNLSTDLYVEKIHIYNGLLLPTFDLLMGDRVVCSIRVGEHTNYIHKFTPPLVVKSNATLKAKHPFSIHSVSYPTYIINSERCCVENCNEELCRVFKTNKLFSDEWSLLPPCKSTVDDKFMLYEDERSYEIDINDNLSMLLFQMKNLSLEDAITITKVKNELYKTH